MNTKYVAEFLLLAQKKNYLESAEELYISQSSLSKHILSLEKELGTRLFNRTTRTVSLTKEGTVFLPYARTIVAQENEFLALLREQREDALNEISIASNSQFTQYKIYPMLIRYKNLYPKTSLNIVIKPHDELKRMLDNHQVDFVWIGETEEEQKTEHLRIHFQKEPVVAIFPQNTLWNNQKGITVRDLVKHELFMQDNSSVEQRIFRKTCQLQNLEPKIISIPGGQSFINTVRAMSGIGLLMLTPAKQFVSMGLQYIPVTDMPTVSANLLYRKDRTMSKASKGFLAYIQQSLKAAD